MADDAKTENIPLSIRFVDEGDYKELSLPSLSGRRCWKKNRPSWFHLKDKSKTIQTVKLKVPVRNINMRRKCDQERQFCDAHAEIESHGEAIHTKVPALAPTKVQAKKSSNRLLSILPHNFLRKPDDHASNYYYYFKRK